MYSQIAEGVDAYRNEVEKYLEWSKEKGYDKLSPEQIHGLEDPDYTKIMKWNAKLEGMAEALGLTKDEVKTIDAECGVVVS